MRSPLSFGMFAAALLAAGTLTHGRAQAMSMANEIHTAADGLKLVEKVLSH